VSCCCFSCSWSSSGFSSGAAGAELGCYSRRLFGGKREGDGARAPPSIIMHRQRGIASTSPRIRSYRRSSRVSAITQRHIIAPVADRGESAYTDSGNAAKLHHGTSCIVLHCTALWNSHLFRCMFSLRSSQDHQMLCKSLSPASLPLYRSPSLSLSRSRSRKNRQINKQITIVMHSRAPAGSLPAACLPSPRRLAYFTVRTLFSQVAPGRTRKANWNIKKCQHHHHDEK
jgi:hypothetical protein